jgi:hypothetical protein
MYSVETFVDFSSILRTLILSVISAMPGFLVGIAVYVVTSLSLHTMAKRRGIQHPWLAWIPYGNLWIMGSISDHYQLMAQYRTKHKRKWLLILQIFLSVLGLLVMILAIITVFSALQAYEDSAHAGIIDIWRPVRDSLLEMGIVWLVMMVVAIVFAVVQYMALYDIYRSCEPGNATLYLVLSIFVSLSQPVFLFLCRNKDDGLPKPQSETPSAAWAPPAPVAEPWNDPTQL